jgi:tetratricopeptide (TPR) repeat protein
MTLNNLGWLALEREEKETSELLVLTLPEAWGAPGVPGAALAGATWRLVGRERLAEACRLFEQAVARQKAALKPAPEHAAYRQRLGDHYRNLARAAVRLGDHGKAAAAADNLVSLNPDSAADCYNAGRFLARCATLAEAEAGPAELSRSYADRAARLLREAVALGHADARDLNENADFAALRGRADFQRLLKDVAAMPKKSP